MDLSKHLEKNKKKSFEVINFKQLDIELQYLMSKIDVEKTLNNLNIDYLNFDDTDDYIWGYCPDHEMYCGRTPSHPKWTLNKVTGKTYCYTESRISDLLSITKNLLGYKSFNEAKTFLLNGEKLPNILVMKKSVRKYNKANKKDVYVPSNNDKLNSVRNIIEEGFISDNCYKFFLKDKITSKTVKEFNIVSIHKGKYSDRALIPFYNHLNNELRGFVAVDLLGIKEWSKRKVFGWINRNKDKINSSKPIKSAFKHYRQTYKKVLFCAGAPTGDHLFGLANLLKHNKEVDEVILVEGERDAIKLQQEGYAAVGTHGTSLNPKQKDILLSIGVKRIILAYDNDDAGVRGAKKIEKMIDNEFYEVLNLKLVDDRDPKHYNGTEFKKLIEKQRRKYNNFWESKTTSSLRKKLNIG